MEKKVKINTYVFQTLHALIPMRVIDCQSKWLHHRCAWS